MIFLLYKEPPSQAIDRDMSYLYIYNLIVSFRDEINHNLVPGSLFRVHMCPSSYDYQRIPFTVQVCRYYHDRSAINTVRDEFWLPEKTGAIHNYYITGGRLENYTDGSIAYTKYKLVWIFIMIFFFYLCSGCGEQRRARYTLGEGGLAIAAREHHVNVRYCVS